MPYWSIWVQAPALVPNSRFTQYGCVMAKVVELSCLTAQDLDDLLALMDFPAPGNSLCLSLSLCPSDSQVIKPAGRDEDQSREIL